MIDATGEIFGEVPDIAERTQALVEPGSVVVTGRVQRQVAGLFVAEERGSHALKGVPGPVTLFRLMRASGGGRRAGQRHLTPLVGRDEEMACCCGAGSEHVKATGNWCSSRASRGSASRGCEEFHARLRKTPHTWVKWSCERLLDDHCFRSLRKLVVGNLNRIANIDNIGN